MSACVCVYVCVKEESISTVPRYSLSLQMCRLLEAITQHPHETMQDEDYSIEQEELQSSYHSEDTSVAEAAVGTIQAQQEIQKEGVRFEQKPGLDSSCCIVILTSIIIYMCVLSCHIHAQTCTEVAPLPDDVVPSERTYTSVAPTLTSSVPIKEGMVEKKGHSAAFLMWPK